MPELPSTSYVDAKTLPKIGPNSIVMRKISKSEEQEQRLKTREAVKQYISAVFGEGLTSSEKQFVAAVNEIGKCSIHLVILLIILLWYTITVGLDSGILKERPFIVRCKIATLEDCLNFSQILDIAFSNKTPTYQTALSTQYCNYDDRDYSQLVATYSCKYESIKNAIKLNRETPESNPCEEFVTVPENFSFSGDQISPMRTLRDDMQLFCDNDVWNRIFVLSKAYGYVLSVLLLTPTADIYGRKPIFMIGSLMHVISCSLVFLPSKMLMAVGFFLSGFGRCAVCILYVLFLELCSEVLVLWIGLLILLVNPIVNLIEFLFNYTTTMWLYVHLAHTSMLLVLPFGICYITESPKWLMFTGNTEAAWKVLEDINGSGVFHDSATFESEPVNRPRLRKIAEFFCQPIFRERITSCIILYFLTSISFYVMKNKIIQDSQVETNIFYLLHFVFELMIAILAYCSAIKFGRRRTSFVFYCLLSIIDAFIFMENQYIANAQNLPLMLYLRDALKDGIICVLCFYTCEMFPTPYRATALNICVMSTAIGKVLQEHFHDMFHPDPRAMSYMPPFIASITCALMVCFLPKTGNDGLPDTPREALLFKLDS